MQFKIISREEATEKGLDFFFTGNYCKWGHRSPRYTSKGAQIAKRTRGNNYATAGLCYHCMELKKKGGGIIGETFEGIMSSWDNSSTTEGAARLPLISGTSSMGYKVVGETIIDEEWYPEASKLLWVTDTNGYVKASYSKDNILRYGKPSTYASKGFMHLHRYVKGVASEVEYMVDHVNGDRRDNRNTNLRLANSLQNGRNSKVIKAGSSKYKGVYLTHRSDRCWKATLMVRGVRVFQKYFFCEIEAAKYYDAYLRYNYPSEFNVYNFPQEDERSAIL